MIKQAFKRLWNDKRGNALVIAGAAMPMVLGSAGLATDTIQWTLSKRQLQRAADSAAIAGVYAIVEGQNISDAVTKDLTYNHTTGIAFSSTPVVTQPAATSAYTNPVKVDLAIQKRLSFSAMFMAEVPTITASATAAIAPTGKYCVVSLENTSTTGIVDSGNATLNLGCGMITNSTSLNAAIATGSATVNATPVAAVGGIQAARQWGSSTLLPFTVAQADPYAAVTPAPPTTCANSDPKVGPSGSTDLEPGCYKGLTLNGPVKLKPGVYYVDGGTSSSNPNGLDIGAQAVVDGTAGVTIVLTNVDPASTVIGNLKINGGATVKLTAQDSGPYKGIAVYQDRRAVGDSDSSNSPNLINGNSASVFDGAFYFPSQQVGFNGNSGLTTNCFQLVSRRVDFKGNMTINNNCTGKPSGPYDGQHVRLVA